MISLLIATCQAGKIDEGQVLLTGLQHLRVLLPAGCTGGDFEAGCEPLLPTGWFTSAYGLLFDLTNYMVDQHLEPADTNDRRKSAGRDIAVVSAYAPSAHLWKRSAAAGDDPGSTGNEDALPMKWYYKNKECYALRHGYSFEFRRAPPGDEVRLAADVDGYRYEIHWIKLAAVRAALRSHDWVFWIDYDSLFGNFSQTLDEFIDVVEKYPGIDLVLQDGPQLSCPNAFLLRSSAWSFHFLDEWERYGRMAVHGRSKMWELRCFNCAVVDHVLKTQAGRSLRNCGELSSHVFLLRHALETSGFGHQQRTGSPAIGKIYFWNAGQTGLRGFLFNVNDDEQQRFFSQPDLYHAGDLAVHWPGPRKDNEVMRAFAAERPGAAGCEAWDQPAADLEGAYRPIGAADAPALFAPRHVLRALVARFATAELAVRCFGEERRALLGVLLQEMAGRRAVFEVLMGRDVAEDERQQALEFNNIRMREAASLTSLPEAPTFDFVYVGTRPQPLPGCWGTEPDFDAEACERRCKQEIIAEIAEGFARLRPGGVLAAPYSGCEVDAPDWWLRGQMAGIAAVAAGGRPTQAAADGGAVVIDSAGEPSAEEPRRAWALWRFTRDSSGGALRQDLTGGCIWAYGQQILTDSDYRERIEAFQAMAADSG